MGISDWSSDVCSSDLAGAQRRDPLVISPGKEIIIENNYLAVSVNAAGDLQLWTFSTQAQLRYKMAATTVCIQRRLEARGPGCQGFFVRRKRRQSRKLGEHVMRSEEHTSELQSLMRISYAVF